MTQETVIYTDGHGIKVTPYQFIVGNTRYLLNGITSVRLYTIRANLVLPITLILLGLAVIVAGLLHLFSDGVISSQQLGAVALTPNNMAVLIGGIILLCGIIAGMLTHDKYAVRITTAEGEKDAVGSPKKDYASQIFTALNEALRPAL